LAFFSSSQKNNDTLRHNTSPSPPYPVVCVTMPSEAPLSPQLDDKTIEVSEREREREGGKTHAHAQHLFGETPSQVPKRTNEEDALETNTTHTMERSTKHRARTSPLIVYTHQTLIQHLPLTPPPASLHFHSISIHKTQTKTTTDGHRPGHRPVRGGAPAVDRARGAARGAAPRVGAGDAPGPHGGLRQRRGGAVYKCESSLPTAWKAPGLVSTLEPYMLQ
jgi:hypothetical protein